MKYVVKYVVKPLKSVDFVEVFQSDLSYDSVFVLKRSYSFIYVDLVMVFNM